MSDTTFKIIRPCTAGGTRLASAAKVSAHVHERRQLEIGSGAELFENLITKKELAHKLSVSEGLINRLMAEEALPHLKIGRAVRFRLSDVLAWFDHKGN